MGLSPSVGSAEGITGFQDFQFGMSLSDVQAITNLTQGERHPRGQWYKASEIVTILGDEYAPSLLFNDAGILTNVSLTREFAGHRITCKGAFDRALGAIQANHGEPDQPPERESDAVRELNSVHFTKSDGSRLTLFSYYLTSCQITVGYGAAPVGAGF